MLWVQTSGGVLCALGYPTVFRDWVIWQIYLGKLTEQLELESSLCRGLGCGLLQVSLLLWASVYMSVKWAPYACLGGFCAQ